MRKLNQIAICFFTALITTSAISPSVAQVYRTMEMREVTRNPKANGETDFKGRTEIFNTEQRVVFLKHYSSALSRFFGDEKLDKKPVTVEKAKETVKAIKPQPQTGVRTRQKLDNWHYIGYNDDKIVREKNGISYWQDRKGVKIENGALKFTESCTVERKFEAIDWRGRIKFDFLSDDAGKIKVAFGNAAVVSDIKAEKDRWHTLEADLDIDPATQGYNVYIDGRLIVDYAPLKDKGNIDKVTISAPAGTLIDNLVVTKFGKKNFGEDLHDRDEPYLITTALDDTFQVTPDPKNCSNLDYDASDWLVVNEMPFAYGGERFKGEKLYLRTTFDTPKDFRSGNAERAILNIEAISPSGEVWVNGKVVHLSKKPIPVEVDVTDCLKNGENIIVIVVDPGEVSIFNRHTAADYHTGWYAGRVWVDYRSKDFIKDPYIVTGSLTGAGADVSVSFVVSSHRWLKLEREVKRYNGFKGSAEVALYEWFPAESAKPAAVATTLVEVELHENKTYTVPVSVPDAKLWSVEKPQLYKVVLTLKDEKGKPVDDLVLTTGLRTISQEGGVFRINGKPSMMNGALLLGHRAPLENISRHMYCAPSYVVVQDILKIKAMNGNTIRMSHHDQQWGGTNDPRYAEYADQLGLMFQWASPAWVRSGSPWQLDFESLPFYVHQLRNNPSVVMWQPANHPKVGPPIEKAMKWFEMVYRAIWQADSSRLISPTASQIRMDAPNDDGTLSSNGKPAKPFAIWTAPMITRGNMDHITGYGANWEGLRAWPNSKKWEGEQGWRADANRTSYLNSKSRAYFDFENEESIGQHNWNLQKGKPEYLIMSYEHDMDVGSIGRRLSTNEWRESQAYQAMSAFEAIKKKRMLGYDGFAWCELNGGGNSATYLKPLLDYYDNAKLSYYALTMVYQPSFACSSNVDTAYGDKDTVDVMVIHMGDKAKADVKVDIRNVKGKIVETKLFKDIPLPEGRDVVNAGSFATKHLPEGSYIFEYELKIK